MTFPICLLPSHLLSGLLPICPKLFSAGQARLSPQSASASFERPNYNVLDFAENGLSQLPACLPACLPGLPAWPVGWLPGLLAGWLISQQHDHLYSNWTS